MLKTNHSLIRRVISFGILVLIFYFGFGLPARAATDSYFNYKARLTSAEYGVNSSVTGNMTITFLPNGEGILYWVTGVGNGVTGAHLHCGTASQNGPLVAVLSNTPSGQSVNEQQIASGTIINNGFAPTSAQCGIRTVADLANAIREGKIYVDIHNLEFPNGAARGQLLNAGTNNTTGVNFPTTNPPAQPVYYPPTNPSYNPNYDPNVSSVTFPSPYYTGVSFPGNRGYSSVSFPGSNTPSGTYSSVTFPPVNPIASQTVNPPVNPNYPANYYPGTTTSYNQNYCTQAQVEAYLEYFLNKEEYTAEDEGFLDRLFGKG